MRVDNKNSLMPSICIMHTRLSFNDTFTWNVVHHNITGPGASCLKYLHNTLTQGFFILSGRVGGGGGGGGGGDSSNNTIFCYDLNARFHYTTSLYDCSSTELPS